MQTKALLPALVMFLLFAGLTSPNGAYFEYARVLPDRLEWMAVAEPLEYQWFYGRPVGDGVEWLPVTNRIPSTAPLGAPLAYSIKPTWFEIQPGWWMVCGYGFFGHFTDCEVAE